MTVTDTFLEEIAKAMNSESYVIPAYQAVGTSGVLVIAASDTALSSEIGSRVSLSTTRTLNEIEFSGIRSGAVVIDTTNGDDIRSTGMFNTATESTSDKLLQGIATNGITQTTNFDVEFITNIQWNRR